MHLFHQRLRGERVETNSLREGVKQLGDEWWLTLESNLPDAWKQYASKIREHVTAVRDHVDAFIKQVELTLAA